MQDDREESQEIETLEDALERIGQLEAELSELQTASDPGQWPKTIKLDPPVPWGKNRPAVESIEIRQPTMGDLRGIPLIPTEWSFDHVISVAVKLTKQPSAFLQKLPAEQARILTRTVRVFFMKCL